MIARLAGESVNPPGGVACGMVCCRSIIALSFRLISSPRRVLKRSGLAEGSSEATLPVLGHDNQPGNDKHITLRDREIPFIQSKARSPIGLDTLYLSMGDGRFLPQPSARLDRRLRKACGRTFKCRGERSRSAVQAGRRRKQFGWCSPVEHLRTRAMAGGAVGFPSDSFGRWHTENRFMMRRTAADRRNGR